MYNLLLKNLPVYCEKITSLGWFEPLNALSNFAFLIGAYYLYRFVKASQIKNRLSVFLIGLMTALGLGSLAWHSYRTSLTMLLDELPIYIFFIVVLYFLVRKLTRNLVVTIFILVLLAIVYYLIFSYVPGATMFYGSFKYVFILVTLAILSILISRKYGEEYSFLPPLAIFAASIFFRIIDIPLCNQFPFGTHFVWHIANATAMYLGSVVIIRLGLK